MCVSSLDSIDTMYYEPTKNNLPLARHDHPDRSQNCFISLLIHVTFLARISAFDACKIIGNTQYLVFTGKSLWDPNVYISTLLKFKEENYELFSM